MNQPNETPTARDQLSNIMAENKITVSAQFLSYEIPPWGGSIYKPQYRVTIKTLNGSRSFDFWAGSEKASTEKELMEVGMDCLHCLCHEHSIFENQTMEDLGYDPDKISHRKIWKKLGEGSKKLAAIIPPDVIASIIDLEY